MSNLKRSAILSSPKFLFLIPLAMLLGTASTIAATNSSPPAATRTSYVGDDACRSCHHDKTISYHQTAHFITSQPPTQETILGKFKPGANTLKTADTNLIFEMQATDAGYFQKAMRTVSPTRVGHRSERFDIVLGSGRKGQTYGFWKTNLLCLLQ